MRSFRTACSLLAVAVVVSLTVNGHPAGAAPARQAPRASGSDLLGDMMSQLMWCIKPRREST